jgi:hypothetical protein
MAVLQVVCDALTLDCRDEFLGACAGLIRSGCGSLVIDLRNLRRVFSIYVGTIMDVNARAQRDGRSLTVVAGPELTKMFRSVVGPETLRICEPASSPAASGRRQSSRRCVAGSGSGSESQRTAGRPPSTRAGSGAS